MIDYNSMTVDELQAEIDKLESFYEHLNDEAKDTIAATGIYPQVMAAQIEVTESWLKHLKALLSRKCG